MNSHPVSLPPQVLPIEGMTCASCVGRVERALRSVPGVADASVNLATERAEIRLSEPVDRTYLVRAVEDAGYAISDTRAELSIEGMTCASCVGRVERALMGVPGVTNVVVNYATERAIVTGSADIVALIAAVEEAGYRGRDKGAAVDGEAAAERREAEAQALLRDVIIAGALTLPVFILEMGSHIIPALHHFIINAIGMQANWLIQFALTTFVLAFPGIRFYAHGFPALLRGTPDMNSLVAVGTMAAYAYSLVATFAPALLPPGTVNVYFEAPQSS